MDHESSQPLPSRRRPVHRPPLASGNRAIIVFLTVCTDGRRPILATPEMREILVASWQAARFWLVGRYVIMPDHVHLFCAPGTNPPQSLTTWVAYWKRRTAMAAGGDVWQKNFWDTQLRQRESYTAKWEYVRQNPVRAGLVSQPEDWPGQGELNGLRWQE